MNEEPNEKKGFIGSFIRTMLLLISVVVITATATYFVTVNITINKYLSKANSEYMITKMSLVKTKLEDTYIRELDEEKMIEGAIKGYVSGVGDKYTSYLDEEDMKSLVESTTGNYVGIGVYMATSTELNGVVIIGLVEDAVAEKAGIKVGDIITKVDDVSYVGKKSDEVTNALKGDAGTKVKVTVKRDNEEIEYEMVREQIKVKTVTSEILDNNIGYIRITSFDTGTAVEFKDHLNKLIAKNPKGIILDLRNNGGGVVGEAVNIADTMIEKDKTILITRDKKGNEKIDKAKTKSIVNVPVIVLVNGSTASASEILASALRDDAGIKIVGTKSYGKGVIQTIFTFKDGTGLKVTTNEYFSPNHNVINEVGIKPDVEVELDREWKGYSYVPFENDKQLQKAIELLS